MDNNNILLNLVREYDKSLFPPTVDRQIIKAELVSVNEICIFYYIKGKHDSIVRERLDLFKLWSFHLELVQKNTFNKILSQFTFQKPYEDFEKMSALGWKVEILKGFPIIVKKIDGINYEVHSEEWERDLKKCEIEK